MNLGFVCIQLIFAEIENRKYYSKIIFKCVNNTVGPIINFFFLMNSAQTVVNSAIDAHCWIQNGQQLRLGKKKKKRKTRK